MSMQLVSDTFLLHVFERRSAAKECLNVSDEVGYCVFQIPSNMILTKVPLVGPPISFLPHTYMIKGTILSSGVRSCLGTLHPRYGVCYKLPAACRNAIFRRSMRDILLYWLCAYPQLVCMRCLETEQY